METFFINIINTVFVNIKSIQRDVYMTALISATLILIAIKYFGLNIPDFIVNTLILIDIIAFIGFVYHLPGYIKDIFSKINLKIQHRKEYKKQINIRYTYYDNIWNGFFGDIEKKFFKELAKKRKYGCMGIYPVIREPFQLMDLMRNKVIIQEHLINDFVVSEFDILFLKWVRKYGSN